MALVYAPGWYVVTGRNLSAVGEQGIKLGFVLGPMTQEKADDEVAKFTRSRRSDDGLFAMAVDADTVQRLDEAQP